MAEKDMTEKMLEDHNDIFSDIINTLLFHGRREVKEDALEQATVRTVYKADTKIREQERDVAKYWRNVNFRIAMFGIENQTSQDPDVALRAIGYDGAAYRDQLYYVKDENDNRKLNNNPRYMVVTLFLFFGSAHWNEPCSLYERLRDIPEELKPYVNDYKANVFEIAWLSDEQVELFQSDFKIVADYFVQMRKNKDYVPSKIKIRHVREVLQLMSVLTKDDRFEEVCNDFEEGAEKNMCEVLDRIENRGIMKGRQEGRQEGKIEVLLSLVKDGILTMAEAAKRADMSERVFAEKMKRL